MSKDNLTYNFNYYVDDIRPTGTIGTVTIRTNNSLYKETESNDCKRCHKYIYPLECMSVMGFRYHRQCFRCNKCDRLLDFKSYRTNLDDLNDRQIYCINHSPRSNPHNNFIFNRSRSKSPTNNQAVINFLQKNI
jgi:hypothetical protein